MSDSTFSQIANMAGDVIQMGASWFDHKDDTTMEAMGNHIKDYEYHLSYQDVFRISVYQYGASCYYSRTGAIKLYKNIDEAFAVGRLMKGRERTLLKLME